jgi:hypothetical protein
MRFGERGARFHCRMNVNQNHGLKQFRGARVSLMALALAGAAFDPSLAHSAPTGSFTLVQPMKQLRR